MTGNEYQEKALRTANLEGVDRDETIVTCALGLTGESGEVADMIKKWYSQGHALDEHVIANELGDILWYISVMAKAIGYPLEMIMYMNDEKLKERYPDGFDSEKSINRKDK